jgi:hypothetical protein
MDQEPISSPRLVMARRKLANALMKYAEKMGWKANDYKVFMRPNPDWNRIHVVFVAHAFEGRDYYKNYAAVMAHLSNEMKDDVEILNSVNLVLRDFKQIEEGGFFGIGPDYSEEPIAATAP